MTYTQSDGYSIAIAAAVMLPFMCFAGWRGSKFANDEAFSQFKALKRGLLWSFPLSWNGIAVSVATSKGVGVGVGMLPSWWLLGSQLSLSEVSQTQATKTLVVGAAWAPPIAVVVAYVFCAIMFRDGDD